jgi:hypothetical protein
MALSDKERKLLWLALDGAAAPGEISNAARMFIEALRKRGCRADELDGGSTHVIRYQDDDLVPKGRRSKPDYGLERFPWGKKHKGERFKDIPVSYLEYQLGWIRSDRERSRRFDELACKIERFLEQ